MRLFHNASADADVLVIDYYGLSRGNRKVRVLKAYGDGSFKRTFLKLSVIPNLSRIIFVFQGFPPHAVRESDQT